MAHSALDFREPAALAIAGAVCRGEIDKLAGRAIGAGRAARRVPPMRLLWKAVEVAAIAEGALPAVPTAAGGDSGPHEPDRGVVHVGQPGRAVIGQIAVVPRCCRATGTAAG